MKAYDSFGHLKASKISCAALSWCLLIPIILVALLKYNSSTFSSISLSLSVYTYKPLSTVEEAKTEEQGGSASSIFALKEDKKSNELSEGKEETFLPLPFKEKTEGINSSAGGTSLSFAHEEQKVNETVTGDGTKTLQLPVEEIHNRDEMSADTKTRTSPDLTGKGETIQVAGIEVKNETQSLDSSKKSGDQITGSKIRESTVSCDLSGQRSDTCSMDGDIRVLGKSSVIMFFSQNHKLQYNKTWKIRPYTRKWEASTMSSIKELTLISSDDPVQAPQCTVNHDVPAIFFSTGGFVGNFFHDVTDVLIPLFITSHQFAGEVQFLVTDFRYQWINKYQPILKHLSHYKVINLDEEDKVHCFSHAHVGLRSHKVLGIDPSKSPNGYSMIDFRGFLRKCFSLKKDAIKRIDYQSRNKPRLLILLRKGSRSFTNEKEVIGMARRVGYKVITAGPEETKNLSRFAKTVNSCDVLMGVHGAGLANMVFLPTNATLIQIIPWGELKWACTYDFGEPAPNMGIRYVDYEIRQEESSLIEQYPRDHAVFKDPLSIQKQGFDHLWSIFLNQQKVKLDVSRFREVLLEVLQSLKQNQ